MTMWGDPDLAAKLKGGLTVPLIVGPMFLVSSPALLIEACRAGVIGSIPALNARSSDILETWLQEITAALAQQPDTAPYAVNLIAHTTNKRLEADLALCVKYRVPVIISSVGSPRRIIEEVRGYGGLVFSDAASVNHARRGAEAGVDGIILLCAGAGGNTGWLSPFSLVSEVRRFFQGPLILAGAISRGRYIHAAEVMGADMVLAGTSFIAATESFASDDYRAMLTRSGADDVILTSEFTGIPSNMLRESLERSNFKPSSNQQGFDIQHEETMLTAWRDVWSAGHGVGDVVAAQPARDIVDCFRADYEESHRSHRPAHVRREGQAPEANAA